jgi:hypothetical protein
VITLVCDPGIDYPCLWGDIVRIIKVLYEWLLKILRDPAVRTGLALLTFFGGPRLLANWIGVLRNPVVLELWILISLGLLALGGAFVIFFTTRPTSTIQTKPEYYEVWGALWYWSPDDNDLADETPVCPEHGVPMRVVPPKSWSGDFRYICQEEFIDKYHTVDGPPGHSVPDHELYPYIAQSIRTKLRLQSDPKIVREKPADQIDSPSS